MRTTVTTILLLLTPLPASSVEAAGKRVMVVHDAAAPGSAEERAVAAVLDLLGHFDYSAATVSTQDYRAGDITRYDATVYLGTMEGADLTDALLVDIYDSDRPVCWLGANLQQLADRFSLGRYGFRLGETESSTHPRRVVYEGQHYRRANALLPEIVVTRPDVCHVLALAQGDGQPLPYAVRSGEFWYFAELPLFETPDGGSHFVLCDQLHSVLGERHPDSRQALICIAGISAESETNALAGLIEYFHHAGVPFAIAVAPEIRDPATGRSLPLSSKRTLVGLLRGAQANGASIVSHGLYAQSPSTVSRAGAGGETGESAVRPRFEKAMSELARCGLYPVAWVSPGAAAPAEDTAGSAALCSTLWQRREAEGARAAFPFLVRVDSFGHRIIPDNLPPLNEGHGEVEAMLADARRYAPLTDAWVTATIDPAASLSNVELLVRGLRQLGYEFANLRAMRNWTEGESLHIHSVDAPCLAGELIPERWAAMLIAPEHGGTHSFERPGSDDRDRAEVVPGALLITYPPGQRPRPILTLEGGMQSATNRLIYRIAHVVVLVGIAACGLLILIYATQVILQRRT